MAEDICQVTQGVGVKLHTNSYVAGGQTVHDEFVVPGPYPYATYIVSPAAGVTCANAGDDIAQLMAGASLKLRIVRIRLEQAQLITAAALTAFTIARVTTAGTGGTAITPSKMDNADGAAGAAAASGVPTASKGAIGAQFFVRQIQPTQTAATAGQLTPYWEWTASTIAKGILIPTGATNGLVIRNVSARAGLSVNFEIEFVETTF